MYLCLQQTVVLLTCKVPSSSLFSYSLCPSVCGWPGASLEIPAFPVRWRASVCPRVCVRECGGGSAATIVWLARIP